VLENLWQTCHLCYVHTSERWRGYARVVFKALPVWIWDMSAGPCVSNPVTYLLIFVFFILCSPTEIMWRADSNFVHLLPTDSRSQHRINRIILNVVPNLQLPARTAASWTGLSDARSPLQYILPREFTSCWYRDLTSNYMYTVYMSLTLMGEIFAGRNFREFREFFMSKENKCLNFYRGRS